MTRVFDGGARSGPTLVKPDFDVKPNLTFGSIVTCLVANVPSARPDPTTQQRQPSGRDRSINEQNKNLGKKFLLFTKCDHSVKKHTRNLAHKQGCFLRNGYHFLVGEEPPLIAAAFCCSSSRSRGEGPGPLHKEAGPN